MYKQIAQNRQRTIWLVLLFSVLIIAVGFGAAQYFDTPVILLIAVLISVFSSWNSYYNGDKMILKLSNARPVQPDKELKQKQIVNLVENLCITAGLPVPKVYIIPDKAPNAFAVGRDPKHASIALTEGLIEKLEKVELEGVIAHELSHIKNYDILLMTVTITLLGVITLVADWTARNRMWSSRNNKSEGTNVIAIVYLLLIILAPIFAQLIYLAVSRQREYLADSSGALLTRYPEGLASALKKIAKDQNKLKFANRATAGIYIINPLKTSKGAFSEMVSTHPPLKKRIAALENMNV
ncbi:MAG: M48 family metallopeptidase [Patescibacteria group bacterium]|nr:M48 family metallopeptidase [Patescibacteria group bacterium]